MQKIIQWLESKRLSVSQRQESPQKRPFKLFQIESSLSCGLSCVMCPWTSLRATAGVMSWATYEKIAANFHLVEGVDLTGGGEPMQNRALVDMVLAAKAAGCQVGFSTNGVLLDRPQAERLVKAGLDWISFSVDAASAETYNRIRQGANFETVMKNIRSLGEVKRGLGSHLPRLMMVFVMMTGENENYCQLPEYIQLASQLGVEQVIAKNLDVILKDGDDERRIFSHTRPPDKQLKEVMESARRQANELGVGFRIYQMQPVEQPICDHNPIHSLFFNWQGQVSPCITLSYADTRYFNGEQVQAPCLHFGNINDLDLPAIWERQEYQTFRQEFEERIQWQRQSLMEAVLNGKLAEIADLPPAPESCRSCYYLYGV
jgi:MoaA/NifB/PqqE/SkfB family radical SAM enzyme